MFTHARTRFVTAAFAALALGRFARAQTGPSLLVSPFPKEQLIDARGSWLYEDAGHVKGSDESLRLSFYETSGRVRLFPGELTSPRVGWDIQYIDVGGNPSVLPGQLTDESLGAAFPVAKIDEWVVGVALGVGYAGASPFGERGAWYGKATAIVFRQFSEKLPVSRWQRDLTDSTVLRNVGVALGHSLLGYVSLGQGMAKLEADPARLAADLDANYEVLAEAIQTVMRRYALPEPYEQLKALTRGRSGMTAQAIRAFVESLALPQDAKERLLALTPATYVGLAEELAKRI